MNSEELVYQSAKAITGVLSTPAWQKKLAALGFTAEELKKAKAMGGELRQLTALQQKEYGEQYNATDAMYQARKDAWEVYKLHVLIARLALAQDRGQYKALQLAGERERNILKWIKQARTFYANAPAVGNRLQEYGITEADLKRGEAMIEAVYRAYDRREQELDEARQSTRARRQAEAKLRRWMKRYERALRFAFEDQPEVLKELGLKVKEEAA